MYIVKEYDSKIKNRINIFIFSEEKLKEYVQNQINYYIKCAYKDTKTEFIFTLEEEEDIEDIEDDEEDEEDDEEDFVLLNNSKVDDIETELIMKYHNNEDKGRYYTRSWITLIKEINISSGHSFSFYGDEYDQFFTVNKIKEGINYFIDVYPTRDDQVKMLKDNVNYSYSVVVINHIFYLGD